MCITTTMGRVRAGRNMLSIHNLRSAQSCMHASMYSLHDFNHQCSSDLTHTLAFLTHCSRYHHHHHLSTAPRIFDLPKPPTPHHTSLLTPCPHLKHNASTSTADRIPQRLTLPDSYITIRATKRKWIMYGSID